jgi:hypothetical protein
MNKEFPELHNFFGAYFHQDWTVEHDTPEQVLDAFLVESHIDDLKAVYKELNALLAQKQAEPALRIYLLKDLSCYYCYWNSWASGESWLRHIEDRLKTKIKG